MGRKRKRLSHGEAVFPKKQRKKPLKEKLAVSDKNREYEVFLKQFESDYPVKKDDSDRQKQPQSVRSANQSASHGKSPQTSRRTVNNRTYSKQNIRQKHRTVKRSKHRRLLAIFSAVLASILLAVIIIIIARRCNTGDDVLSGTWYLDGVTVYRFDGKGNGSLNLPNSTYPFTYKMNDNSLIIDFESEAARDITYSFAVENGKLSLVSVEKGKEITYELTKTSDR